MIKTCGTTVLRITLLSFLFLICFLSPAISKTVTLDNNTNKIPLGLNIDILSDEKGVLTIKDVTGEIIKDKWIASDNEKPGFGFTNTVYWVRFRVENTTEKSLSFLLEQSYPLIDHLTLYIYENEDLVKEVTVGDSKPFDERPYNHRTFVIPITIEGNSSATCYLRYQSESAMNLHLNIWSSDEFQRKAATEYNFLMLYYGVFVVMIGYNLVVFLFIRRIEYLHFVLFIFFFLIFIMTQNGTAFQFLWPNYPKWANFCIPVSLVLLVYFGLRYTALALDTVSHAPRLNKSLQIIAYTALAGFPLSLILPYRPAMIGSAALAVIVVIFILFLGFKLAFQKYRPAYFFVGAWSAFLLGAFLYISKSFGIISAGFIADWSLHIGSAGLVVLLSTALADSINTMRQELMVLTETLEIKVEERTEELSEAMEEMKVINTQLTKTKDELWGEMELAKKIQTALLPKQPTITGYDISAFMKPADEVGGDYYDVINIEDKDWIVIGDVSGHGVPAGLIMMMVQTSIHSVLKKHSNLSASDLLEIVNAVIAENIKKLGESKYMTITVLACLEDGKFHFSGLHQDILIYRSEKRDVELVETNGIWIGLVDEINGMVKVDDLKMNSGDAMLLYTDGITEAFKDGKNNSNGKDQKEMFSDERLVQVFKNLGAKSSEEIKSGILEQLKDYTCHDDVTMVAIKRI